MASLMKIEEFAQMSGIDESEVLQMCSHGKLKFIENEDGMLIDMSEGTKVAIANSVEVLDHTKNYFPSADFVEKTIGTIVSFHEKVMVAKDETIDALKRENMFLKEGLLSMQEIYDTDRDSINILNEQLRIAQEELEFMKRKYRLMWGQVVEKHANNA